MAVNPLNGQPLQPYQIVVEGGPDTNNRVTVVDIRPGAATFPWISQREEDDGDGIYPVFYDNGIPGGSFDGNIQTLEELVTTAPAPKPPQSRLSLTESTVLGVPLWLWGVGIFGYLASRRSRGGRSWE